MRSIICAVDVGTGSARAGFFDAQGRMLARAEAPIDMRLPLPDFAEQNSEQIWRAVCTAVREARGLAKLAADDIVAIAFDATCSLVVRGAAGEQVSVAADGAPGWDTIVWQDHRAIAEADLCTATRHRVLDFAGGVMSPEMQMPKLMWLKRHAPQQWAKAGLIFDLADFLTFRATGQNARSRCTLTCKWNYLAHDAGWQDDFLQVIGLDDLAQRAGLPPQTAHEVGAALGRLCGQAADELGLARTCLVATSLIDAFAGCLGVIGGLPQPHRETHLAMVAGTSGCVMGYTADANCIPGIWGPYHGATLPGVWQYEGGQSAAGALLDHVVHVFGNMKPDAAVHARIASRIAEMRRTATDPGEGVHILPDFSGNRSPHADPHLRGVISGLTLDRSFDGLCRIYWRACVALALGMRQILDHLIAHGRKVEMLHAAGGQMRNPMLLQLYADATGLAICRPEAEDAVLLGTAMVAACAAGLHCDLETACRAMQSAGSILEPDTAMRERYDRDYRIFLKMQQHRRELASI